MQGPMPSQKDVYDEFVRRDMEVKARLEEDRQAKQAEKQKRVAMHLKNSAMRSGTPVAEGDEAEKVLKPEKKMLNWEKVFANNTEFYSTWSPDMIEDALLENLRSERIEPSKVSKDTYKVRFTMNTKNENGDPQDVEMCVRILQVKDNLYCVEFSRRDGDMIRYHEHFNNFKNNVLKNINDAAAV